MSSGAEATGRDAEQTVGLMRRAAQANAEDRFLRGSLLELPGGGDVLVSGDLHGSLQNLQLIVHRAALKQHHGRHLVLQELVHSDEERPDGRCLSFRCVETAARLKVMAPSQVHFLLGNHEMAEVLGLAIGRRGRDLSPAFDLGLEGAYRDRWREVKQAYCEFWRTVPLAARTANRVFIAHSTPQADHVEEVTLEYLRGLRLGEGLARKSPGYNMLWGRDYAQETADRFAQQVQADLLLVAHAATDQGFSLPNSRHIVIDSSTYDGCTIVLPLDVPLSQEAARRHIERINP